MSRRGLGTAWLVAVVVACFPVAAWALVKPVRVLAPALAGVPCPRPTLCIEEAARYPEASALYEASLAFVNGSVGSIRAAPSVIFCSSAACFERFGLSKPSGHTFGTFGIVIGPRGWQPHYVRHEMIHHLQAERLGSFERRPEWFSEGMAYELSADPRPLLSPQFEQYRSQFRAWYQRVGKEQLWSRAAEL